MSFNNFKGRAKPIDDIDLPKLGALIGVGEDELHAFIEVETKGTGFDPQGRPRILFERHKFWKYLPAAKRKQAEKLGLAAKVPGGYGKESEQYAKLKQAMAIDERAALFSCSWGLGQIMGFNYELTGYTSVEDMILDFMDDEEHQLAAAVKFIVNTKLDDELRTHNWAGFAKGYNGDNYKINKYDERLADAYAKWKRIKDTPLTLAPEPPPIQTPPPPEEYEDLPDAHEPVTSSGSNVWIFGAILVAAAAAVVTKYLEIW